MTGGTERDRPWILTSTALALLIAGGVGFSMAFTTGNLSWSGPMLVAVAGRIPLLLFALLSFASEPMDRRARWKVGMVVTTVLGAGLMVMWYLVLGPALIAGRLLDPLRLGAVVFSIADVVLLVGVGTVLMRGSVSAARRPRPAARRHHRVPHHRHGVLYMSVRKVGPDAIIPTLLIAPILLSLLARAARGTRRRRARARGYPRLTHLTPGE